MENALQVIEQKQVTFYDDELIAIRAADGQVYVSVRHMCDSLGLARQGQVRRIKQHQVLSNGFATGNILLPVGMRTANWLRVDLLPLWLSGIRVSAAKEEIRPKLERFQQEAAKVLWDAFQEGSLSLDPSFDELLNRADKEIVEAYQLAQSIMKLARNQVLLSGKLEDHETRLQRIEADLGNEARYITNSQAMQLSQAVKMLALELGKRTGGNEFQGVWGEIHRQYQISSYLKLPAVRFDEAIGFLREWWESLVDGQDVPF